MISRGASAACPSNGGFLDHGVPAVNVLRFPYEGVLSFGWPVSGASCLD